MKTFDCSTLNSKILREPQWDKSIQCDWDPHSLLTHKTMPSILESKGKMNSEKLFMITYILGMNLQKTKLYWGEVDSFERNAYL